jgi:hypothetical protein
VAVICLNCKEVLFEVEPPSSSGVRNSERPPRRCVLEEEDDINFYRCPACKSKNIVIETRTPNGFPHLTVVAVVAYSTESS